MQQDKHNSHIQNAEAAALGSKLNRRQFMEYAAAMGLTASVASTIWSDTVEAATPKKGGHAIFAVDGGSTSDSLDPAVTPAAMLITIRLAMGAALTQIEPNGDVTPWLAESYEPSTDAKVWRFKLRNGVEFHNGKSLTAADVIANYNYHLAEDSKSPMKGVLADVASVSADGDTIVFQLTAGNADFPALLTNYNLTIEASDGEKISWDPPNGLGPFILDDFEPGVRAAFRKNPNYFIPDRPNFDSVELLNVSDMTARVSALLTGGAHVISSVDPSVAGRVDMASNVSVLAQTSGGFMTYDMKSSDAPLSDKNIRLALKHGIDREEFLAKVLKGYGSIGNDHPIGPAYKYHSADIPQHAYDPDKAKYYLKQAGQSSLSVSLHTGEDTFSGALDGAILFSESAKKAGIELNAVREPNDGYWSDVWGKKPIFASYWSQYASADLILSLAYGGKSGWNVTGFDNDRFNTLLVEARAELDDAKRSEMYHEMQAILHSDGPSIVPAYRPILNGVSDKIGHNEGATTTRDFSDGRGLERWWMK